MRKFVILAALIGVVACQPDTGPGDKAGGVECPGGTVVNGMAGPTCTKPTPDAGKACQTASDCSGACLAETMTCSTMSPQFGCYEVVMEDGQKASLCVD